MTSIDHILHLLNDCTLCPHNCHVNRLNGETGFCNTGRNAVVSSYSPHYGEESILTGSNGSGTIFFTHCNLACSFCQNFNISHDGIGMEVTDEYLSEIMIELQEQGCHNINLVSPSHVVPQIIAAFKIAKKQGLKIPMLYNTGGYDKVETLKLLEGIIDIYMPDIKTLDPVFAEKVCGIKHYPETVKKAIKEMYRQVENLYLQNGIASKGLLLRHLVLPNRSDDAKNIIGFIADEITPNTYVNIMSQYKPCGNAFDFENLSRPISKQEFNQAILYAQNAGLTILD